MSSIEYFFDPVCPFAWVTSRWVQEVRQHRDIDVQWRFISLEEVNAEQFARDDEAIARGEDPQLPLQYRATSRLGNRLLRVAAALRVAEGNQAVEDFYTAVGNQLHPGGLAARVWKGADVDELFDQIVGVAGVAAEVLAEADDPRAEKTGRAESELALARTGKDVGTPIISWDLERPEESSLFGPVISRIPRGEEAARLWDAVSTVARTPGIAELKRSLRADLDFG